MFAIDRSPQIAGKKTKHQLRCDLFDPPAQHVVGSVMPFDRLEGCSEIISISICCGYRGALYVFECISFWGRFIR